MDLDRIKRNVAKMSEAKAPIADIDKYIASEGVTVDQVRNHKPGNWLQRQASNVYDAVIGKQDPAYSDTPYLDLTDAFPEQAGDAIQIQTLAKATTFDDAAYGDILKSRLGDKFIRTEKDANGYDVMVYHGPNGHEAKGYVNKPGLDWQDVDRVVSNMAPFLVTGGVAGAAMRGAGRAVRVGGQAVTAASTSLGLDAAAVQQGSEQGGDLTRAGIAGAAGGAGELASHVLSPLLRSGRAYVDGSGILTKRGERAARASGLDPSKMTPEQATDFARNYGLGRDGAEAAVLTRADEFGLKSTKATRTKDPRLSAVEKDIRAGNLGPAAARLLKEFDEQSKAALEGAAFSGNPGRIGIGETMAPARGAAERHPQVLGASIREGVDSAKSVMKAAEGRAWDKVTDMRPTADGLAMLPDIITRRVGNVTIDPQLTPVATRMAKELDAFMNGAAVQEPVANVIKQSNIETVDLMRRRLLGAYKAAKDPADMKAAKAIYKGFDEWMETTAEQGLINGSPEAYAALRIARDRTKEIKGLLEPRLRSGKLSPAGNILKNISDNADTPERVITTLFGGAGPHTMPKTGTVEALHSLKNILSRTGKSGAEETWQDIKLAYWTRLVTGKNGEVLSPKVMHENLKKVFQNQRSILGTLYSPRERALMQRFTEALKDTIFVDPNPSGTASALRAMFKNEDNVMKTMLRTQSKRELFSKHNVLLSRIYSMLAKKMPIDPLGFKEHAATSAARRAVSQDITRRPADVWGNKTSAIGAASYDEQSGP